MEKTGFYETNKHLFAGKCQSCSQICKQTKDAKVMACKFYERGPVILKGDAK